MRVPEAVDSSRLTPGLAPRDGTHRIGLKGGKDVSGYRAGRGERRRMDRPRRRPSVTSGTLGIVVGLRRVQVEG